MGSILTTGAAAATTAGAASTAIGSAATTAGAASTAIGSAATTVGAASTAIAAGATIVTTGGVVAAGTAFIVHAYDKKQEANSTKPQKYSETIKKKFDEFCANLEKDKGSRVDKNIAFLGPTSAGKSTLINAIFGEDKCEAGMGECTTGVNKVGEIEGCSIYDVFGNSDSNRYEEPENLVFMKTLKLVVIVYTSSPKSCKNLIRICDKLGLRFLVVRNKVDEYNQARDFKKSLVQYKKDDEALVKEMIEDKDLFLGLFFLSATNKIENEDSNKHFEWEAFDTKLRCVAITEPQQSDSIRA